MIAKPITRTHKRREFLQPPTIAGDHPQCRCATFTPSENMATLIGRGPTPEQIEQAISDDALVSEVTRAIVACFPGDRGEAMVRRLEKRHHLEPGVPFIATLLGSRALFSLTHAETEMRSMDAGYGMGPSAGLARVTLRMEAEMISALGAEVSISGEVVAPPVAEPIPLPPPQTRPRARSGTLALVRMPGGQHNVFHWVWWSGAGSHVTTPAAPHSGYPVARQDNATRRRLVLCSHCRDRREDEFGRRAARFSDCVPPPVIPDAP